MYRHISREKLEIGLQGLKEIREAALYLIVLMIVALVIVIVFYAFIFSAIMGVVWSQHYTYRYSLLIHEPIKMMSTDEPFAAIIGLLVMLVIVIIILALILLYIIYGKLLPGASKLAIYNPEYSTAASLIKIGYIGGLILAVIGALTIFIHVGIVLLVLALIFFIIARIGLAILCFKLNDDFDEGIILAAGIVFILSIFLNIDFIAWILLYVGLESAIRKMEERIKSTEETIPPPTSGEEIGEAIL